MKQIHPHALFRLSVLGPLASRDRLEQGDLKRLLRELSTQSYAIPNSRKVFLSEKTIEGWYYAWKRDGIEALTPKPRSDRGLSKMSGAIQDAICTAKKENPGRSIRIIRQVVGASGLPGATKLSRSSIHRLLQTHGISNMPGSAVQPVERRSFVAARAGDIWYGDVMHGPKVFINGQMRKAYLVTFMDDASRLISHSAFCPAESALEVEGVLKQAVLKRGLPTKLVIDNGAAYRAETLQSICARLEIRLIYCRPRTPEGKGKIERPFQYIEGNLLCGREFQDMEDLRGCARWWLAEKSDMHRHDTTNRLPLELFLEQEQAALQPMPLHLYDSAEVALRVCSLDGYIDFETNRYPVPYDHVTDILTMKATEHEVLIYSPELSLLVRHERLPAGAKRTLDGTDIHRIKTLRYGLESVQVQFMELGAYAEDFLRGLKISYPKNAGFHARYILHLKERYHCEDINSAL